MSRRTIRSICGCTVLTIAFSERATETTIIAVVGFGRSAAAVLPLLQADMTRVSGRRERSSTSLGPWASSWRAGPCSMIGTRTLGPKRESASVWAREDSEPATTVTWGESPPETFRPTAIITAANTAHAASVALGCRTAMRARCNTSTSSCSSCVTWSPTLRLAETVRHPFFPRLPHPVIRGCGAGNPTSKVGT